MIVINRKKKGGKIPKLRERLVEFLKIYLVIKPLQYFYKNESENILITLKSLSKGTIGADLYAMMIKNDLKIIPKFENHDLKHLILGYGMTSIEEIKMQAYLFENGNKSIFCILFLSSGILFPEEWNSFYNEFKKGKKSICIHDLSFNENITKQTRTLKTIYNTASCQNNNRFNHKLKWN